MNIDLLVDFLVETAKKDQTAPDPDNIKAHWISDMLFQAVDKYLVVGLKAPKLYAQIGREVYEQVKDLPEMAALAKLAVLRGERLMPVSKDREQAIVILAQELEKLISSLPGGTRKMRCKSLFDYHMSIFYELYKWYDLVVKFAAQSAYEADSFGDKAGSALARMHEALFELKQQVLGSWEKHELDPELLFSILEKRCEEVKQTSLGTQFELQWQADAVLALLEACYLLKKDHPRFSEWAKFIERALPKLGFSWVENAALVLKWDKERLSW